MAKYVKTEQGYIETADFLDGKMDKNNPTGTGSFSLNRKAGSTVGDKSHTEGNNTTASGNYSHAEGFETIASGNASHAEGATTTASGRNSHAEGQVTKAASSNQHAQGKYNIEDSSDVYADIIGNGTPSNRSNAATVDWSGNAWYAGDVYVGSTSGTNKDEGSKKLATEEYVDNSIIVPLPTVSDNGKYLGCENGAAKWLPVEASGGDKWELIDTIPLVKDTVVYDIASFEKYKKIAATTRKRLVSGSASGINWVEFRNENGVPFRAIYDGGFFTYVNAAVVIIAEGNLLKFGQFRSNNVQTSQNVFYTYFLYNGEYKGTRMAISISEGNAANLNDDASIEVYGVRR